MTLHEYGAICPVCGKVLVMSVRKSQAEEAAMIHFLATDHKAMVGRIYEPVIHQGEA